MPKILIFGGTTEGRILFNKLINIYKNVYLSVATDYGKAILKSKCSENIFCSRIDKYEISKKIINEKFDIVIDATHPYAKEITKNILYACDKTGIKYFRVIREMCLCTADIYFDNNEDAIEFLNTKDGNILLTTGSKELDEFVRINNYKDRLFVRVLPVKSSIDKCFKYDICGKNLICMQGNFSVKINEEIIKMVNASFLVTKNSGKIGGFEQKIEACKNTNITSIVIGKCIEENGFTVNSMIEEMKKIIYL